MARWDLKNSFLGQSIQHDWGNRGKWSYEDSHPYDHPLVEAAIVSSAAEDLPLVMKHRSRTCYNFFKLEQRLKVKYGCWKNLNEVD